MDSGGGGDHEFIGCKVTRRLNTMNAKRYIS